MIRRRGVGPLSISLQGVAVKKTGSRTRIVATLGPASSDTATLTEMLRAGLDVARINMSHGSHEEHGARLETLRSATRATSKSCAVLLDLCGPKIRTGALPAGVPMDLVAGQEVTLVSGGGAAAAGEIPTNYPHLHEDIDPGDAVLLSDGKIRLVLSHKDPGVPNWLDTGDHQEGLLTYRWFWPESDPTPTARVIPLADVTSALPADTPRIDEHARRAEIRERKAHLAWRFRT